MARIDTIAEQVSVLMPMIARRILMGFFQSVSITQTQIFTIMTLSEKAPVRLSDLGHKLDVSAPTVTGIVDRLEKLGYAKRRPDPKDRRAIYVELTAKGRGIARKLKLTIKRKWKSLLVTLPGSDQEHFVRILAKVRGNIK